MKCPDWVLATGRGFAWAGRWLYARKAEFWLVAWTAALAFVTGASVYVLWQTDHTLRQTLELQNDTARRQLRAYLTMAKNEISIEPQRYTLTFTFKNVGQTPAHDVNPTIQSGVYLNIVDCKKTRELAKNNIRAYVAPGDDYTNQIEGSFPDKVTLPMIEDRTAVVCIHGRVTYNDTFGRPHHYTFSAYGARAVDGRWAVHDLDGSTGD